MGVRLCNGVEVVRSAVPIGVTKAFLSLGAPFLIPVARLSLPFPPVLSAVLPPPNAIGPFSSFSGILNGVFGALFPGVFGGSCRVPWFNGLEAAAV